VTPELEVLEAVTRRLDEAGIPYMLTGSMVSALGLETLYREIEG